MSKTISMVAIVGTLVVIGGIIINGSSKTVEYVAQEPEVITKEVTPDWAQDEEAVKAAQAVIRRKETEAELSSLNDNWASTTAWYEAEKAKYEKQKEELEKELGLF